eukprot:jgi/Mesvir1/23678/Mv18634-RA.1
MVSGNRVLQWLTRAGLGHYSDVFASVDETAFKGLLMQDYGKYGVTSMEDKQRLFRLVKTVNTNPELVMAQEPAPPTKSAMQPSRLSAENNGLPAAVSAAAAADPGADIGGGGLLDLNDINDEELFEDGDFDEDEFASSPTGVRDGEHYYMLQNDYAANAVSSPRVGAPAAPTGSMARIRVVVRKRPMNKKELGRKETDVISMLPDARMVVVHETKTKVDLTRYVEKHEFQFDDVFHENVDNDQVYRQVVQPLVGTIFNRAKATCFAYGQTGSGKTYTMQPLPIRAMVDIFAILNNSDDYADCKPWLSFYEIYGGKVFDLLNQRQRLCMREDSRGNVCIVGLREHMIEDVETVRQLIDHANQARSTGSTGANAESSRSHAIMAISLKRHREMSSLEPGTGKVIGKLSFIDLAGSERGADTTDNDRQTRLEGAEINKSLLALKECIRALDHEHGHIPFRGSKLTEVLRDSFIGNSFTVMIANISPNSGSCEHTLNTLRYSDRVKGLSKGQRSNYSGGSGSGSAPNLAAIPLHPALQEGLNPPMSPSVERMMAAAANNPFAAGLHRRVGSRGDDLYAEGGSGAGSGAGEPASAGDSVSGRSSAEDRSVSASGRRMDTGDPAGLAQAHEKLMNTVLEEEEEVISLHRRLIEETMDIVREEMKLLADVDQPGSAIDSYVTKLADVLRRKAGHIAELQGKLDRFQQHLKEEEILSKTIGYQR